MSLIDALDRPWDDHFDAPIIHHGGIDDVIFTQPERAVHVVDAAHGDYNLAFYAQFGSLDEPSERSDELVVSLHGAATGALRYPQFRRVQSLQGKSANILSFADPTLQYSLDPEFRIGWYAGGAEWDPLSDIAKLVQLACEYYECEHVMFVGSSAGGHAALRVSTRFEGSLAFVMDPQTSIARYYWPSRNRLLQNGWPELSLEEAMQLNADRFDLAQLYANLNPQNHIYYRQSTGDAWHQRVHAEPFHAALEPLQGTAERRYRFVYEAGEKEGHGKITAREFDEHYARAVGDWRKTRRSRSG